MNMAGITVRKRKRIKRFSERAILPVAAIVAAVLLLAVSLAVRRPLYAAAAETARDEAVRALSQAVPMALEGFSGAFISIETVGKECFVINADTALVNRLIAAVTEGARELLLKSGGVGVTADLGTASGLAILSGRGPKVSARFEPLGSVRAEPVSSLRSSGINQSLFVLELKLTARVLVQLAGKDEEIEVKTTVPIAETVVVGRVPQVYTNVADEEDMLNLIPNEVP